MSVLDSILVVFVVCLAGFGCGKEYKPTWDSIDSRPLPNWYDDSKLGIFSHWGVYSVPAYGSEWFWWYWKGLKKPEFAKFVEQHWSNHTTYSDFANEFKAQDFDAQNFAEIIKSSGARYFVLTSKHHEGFTLWPSKTAWNWNAVDVGPHRDLVDELSKSIRQQNLHFGLYFSLMDWFHPLYLQDGEQGKNNYVETVSYPQLLELVNQYQPDVIWSDGDWDRKDVYWKSKEFLAWLYNSSPIKDRVVVNDRWGYGIMGKHGGFLTVQDHFNPGHLLERKWENCLTLDKRSWGYRRNIKASDVLTLKEIVAQLATTISCGGNMLLNIGPDSQGRIIPIFEERLRALGEFVNVNEEAIFGTKPWIHQNDSQAETVWYTSRVRDSSKLDPHRPYNAQDEANTIIYAFVLNIPANQSLDLKSVKSTQKTRVTLLGTEHKFQLENSTENVVVDLSQVPWQEWPSTEHIVLKIEYASSSNVNPLSQVARWKSKYLKNPNSAINDDHQNPYGFHSSEEQKKLL